MILQLCAMQTYYHTVFLRMPLCRSCEYATRSERKYFQRHAKSEDFQLSDLVSLSEMNPPVHIMPFGNVGTPVSVFLQFIQQCQLPARYALCASNTNSSIRSGCAINV